MNNYIWNSIKPSQINALFTVSDQKKERKKSGVGKPQEEEVKVREPDDNDN